MTSRPARALTPRALGRVVVLGMVLGLAACGSAESVWAPDEVVAQSRYIPEGPSRVTLITVISNRDGSGGHSALLIDGPERVLFDPAGSWRHPLAPERNDVLYGMTPQLYDFYIDYHARETYHVVEQELDVTPLQAATLIEAVEAYGPVPRAQCSVSISSILASADGFEPVSRNWFPTRTMAAFGEIPGVRASTTYDDDSDDNYEMLNAQAAAQARMERVRAQLE
ncbi:hypothetical protein P6F26_15555 [Roseibacterium sp. SDUM158017]|uniref:hypothetical protein n=1 Tax=Roseicyclus salinarum TaxID=3036773 RepID=UPI0024151E27|nr:hypothetical protein [Roseibacterium sp. SDUM158017]MDG4649861.1 hypothetical protein [Roseibacterium sp. SDUM158017]